jgi:hypothetical protein
MIKADRCSCPNEKHCTRNGSELSDTKDLDQVACSKVQASDAGKDYSIRPTLALVSFRKVGSRIGRGFGCYPKVEERSCPGL